MLTNNLTLNKGFTPAKVAPQKCDNPRTGTTSSSLSVQGRYGVTDFCPLLQYMFCLLLKKQGFPLKIVAFSFDAGIVSTLFIWCDECRRPKTGRPRGGSVIKMTPLPAVPRRGPEEGVLRISHDFLGSGVNV